MRVDWELGEEQRDGCEGFISGEVLNVVENDDRWYITEGEVGHESVDDQRQTAPSGGHEFARRIGGMRSARRANRLEDVRPESNRVAVVRIDGDPTLMPIGMPVEPVGHEPALAEPCRAGHEGDPMVGDSIEKTSRSRPLNRIRRNTRSSDLRGHRCAIDVGQRFVSAKNSIPPERVGASRSQGARLQDSGLRRSPPPDGRAVPDNADDWHSTSGRDCTRFG